MRVVIVGAGVAGLACAARLAAAGNTVRVVEAASEVGGKMSELRLGDYRFDAGPSLFTLPDELDAVFTSAARPPRNYYDYERLETCCQYFFADGNELRAHADPERFAAEVESTFGEPKAKVLSYLAHARGLYDATSPLFLGRSLHRFRTYTSKTALRALWKLPFGSLLTSMHEVNRRWFNDPRLVQLFDRYATYNGSNPYQAPGILTQIPHLEHNLGAYFPKGGMVAIPRALFKLGVELGVEFEMNTRAERITHDGQRVSGVQTSNGQFSADVVVCAGDVVPAYRKLLPDLTPPAGVIEQERSSSAVIFYWGIKTTFPDLDVHNIFFGADYESEFADIFERKGAPTDPTVYVHISSKVAPADAPLGSENWFVMVNVAANQGQDWTRLVAETRTRVLERLSRSLNTPIEPLIESESVLEPRLLESRTSSFMGALYGPSSNRRQAAFLRHPNFSRHLRGLYFCGGSVHPGGGIPLCLSSAKIVAAEVAMLRSAAAPRRRGELTA